MLRRNRTVSCPSAFGENETECSSDERHISFPIQVKFLSAVQDKDSSELSRILSQHLHEIDVNKKNHMGVTALHQSVVNKNLDGVKLLLTNGANVNCQDVNGHTPLHTASEHGCSNIASMLIVFGADLFQTTIEGELAVDVAKNSIIADLIAVEMCSQIQNQVLNDKYRLLFQLIQIWGYIKERLVEWHGALLRLVLRGVNRALTGMNLNTFSLREVLADT
uniref:Protein phosphatase 1 regulatory subunit 12B-like n=1 Tax=Saccoglossus kowalevskii TaxID=10224 RepID=A0ABM0MAL7_SACKO|nr:PREDICTED: protein phosphatase 1 regulatory subunit 12B-like [Saccoglossus kowalevskii]